MIAYNIVIIGERLGRPPGPNEWLSDEVFYIISRCRSPSWDSRLDVDEEFIAHSTGFAMATGIDGTVVGV